MTPRFKYPLKTILVMALTFVVMLVVWYFIYPGMKNVAWFGVFVVICSLTLIFAAILPSPPVQ